MNKSKEPAILDDDEEDEEDLDEEEVDDEVEVEDDGAEEGAEDEGEDEEGEDEEIEDLEIETIPVNTDDAELIDLIIDQSDSHHRVYTDILATADNMYNTYPYLTKYEKARILGIRAEQLGRNAPPLVTFPPGLSDFEIAQLEIMKGRCPWMIARPLPNGNRLLIGVNLLKLL